ncbi:MAG: cytochrome c biogenesis protein ResB [bacterium]
MENAPKDPGADNAGKSAPAETGIFDWLWKFFGELKVGIVLLIITALASVAGTLIQQKAHEEQYVRYYGLKVYSIAASPLLERFFRIDFDADPEVYVNHYGRKVYGVLRAAGLTNVYGSPWFIALLALLGFSIVVCSVNRFRTLTGSRAFRVKELDARSVEKMPYSASAALDCPLDHARETTRAALASAGYRMAPGAENDGRLSFTADRGTIRHWGSLVTHVSILVIYIGALAGKYGGYEDFAAINEGESYFEKKAGFWVRLNDFSMEMDERFRPLDYKSDLSVFDGGKEVARKTIEVNHPLVYRGVYFYQSSYGLTVAELIVRDPGGGVRTLWIAPERPFAAAPELPVMFFTRDEVFPDEKNPRLILLYQTSSGAVRRLGWLGREPEELFGYGLSLGAMRTYTGLQVKKDPGVPVVWAGCAMMVAGLFITFYVSHRRLFGVVDADEGKRVRVTVGGRARPGDEGFGGSFERVAAALRKAEKAKKFT